MTATWSGSAKRRIVRQSAIHLGVPVRPQRIASNRGPRPQKEGVREMAFDLESKTPAGMPLTIGVEGDQLVIRIGVDTLAFCFEVSDDNQPYDGKVGDFRRAWKVTDTHKFAEGVGRGLRIEEEDGSTPLTKVFDEACIRAIEDDMGVDQDG